MSQYTIVYVVKSYFSIIIRYMPNFSDEEFLIFSLSVGAEIIQQGC